MSDYIDLTNQRFGKLVVLQKSHGRYTSGGNYKITWICKCDCGNVKEIDGQHLRIGHTTSCGCEKKNNKGNKFEDLVGQRFNRLTVIRYIPQNERTTRQYNWLCRCDCGNEIRANAYKLKQGLQQSCGCLKEEMKYNIGNVNKKYKHTNKRLYGIYKAMVNRCTNPSDSSYHNYGGRGITVCAEWLGEYGYDVFAEWALSSNYHVDAKRGECTIDRIDVNGDYSPTNCRWITNKAQQNNKRGCRMIEHNGEVHSMKEWSEILGIGYQKIRYGLNHGKSLSEILNDKP